MFEPDSVPVNFEDEEVLVKQEAKTRCKQNESENFDKELKAKILFVFRDYIAASNILPVFHKYDVKVLSDIDKEDIKQKIKTKGKYEGAELLLDRLIPYYNWFPCLINVLRDPNVKYDKAADLLERIKGELFLKYPEHIKESLLEKGMFAEPITKNVQGNEIRILKEKIDELRQVVENQEEKIIRSNKENEKLNEQVECQETKIGKLLNENGELVRKNVELSKENDKHREIIVNQERKIANLVSENDELLRKNGKLSKKYDELQKKIKNLELQNVNLLRQLTIYEEKVGKLVEEIHIPDDFTFYGDGGNTSTNWKKGSKIGQGAFGEVFEAKITLERPMTIAVKQIRRSLQSDDVMENELKEIELLKKLSHPKIVGFYGYCADGYFVHIFLEHMKDGSLRTFLIDKGPMEEDMIRKTLLQILDGIQYLHSKKILHRDLKSENILMNGNNIKLADFGVSKCFQTISQAQTQKVGTANYMAPEMINSKKYSYPVDVWGFGCVALEMMTGKLPFTNWEYQQILFVLAGEKPSPLEHEENCKLTELQKKFLSDIFQKKEYERPLIQQILLFPYLQKP